MDIPAGYAAVEVDGSVLVARVEVVDVARRALVEHGTLFGWAAAQPEARALQSGRGRLYSIPALKAGLAAADRWVVRHYRRGGAVASWLDDRYLRLGEPRPLRELRASAAVRARGIATPEVAAAAVYPAGIFYRADLATREVPNAIDLGQLSFESRARPTAGSYSAAGAPPDLPAVASDADVGGSAPRDVLTRAWAAAGRLVRRLHEAGVVHRDLNLKNILLEWTEDRPRAYVLDLDRCRVRPRVSDRRRRRMLRRIRRSLAKWEAHAGRALPPEAWRAFEAAYAARRGGGPDG